MDDPQTANLIQIAVMMERERCAAIALREALWLLNTARAEPLLESNAIRREAQVCHDIADAILKGE